MKKRLLVLFTYSFIFMILLLPYTGLSFKTITGGVILGFFAGILNSIRYRLAEPSKPQ